MNAQDPEIQAIEEQIRALKKKLTEARRRATPRRVADYDFRTAEGKPIKLSALFGGKPDLIVIHNMGQKCVYCTLWADGFNGVWRHLADRAALVVSSPDEPAAMKAFAQSRGW